MIAMSTPIDDSIFNTAALSDSNLNQLSENSAASVSSTQGMESKVMCCIGGLSYFLTLAEPFYMIVWSGHGSTKIWNWPHLNCCGVNDSSQQGEHISFVNPVK